MSADNDPGILLESHWRRSYGASGFRSVALDVRNDESVTYRYEIDHLWVGSSAECRSLFLLRQPSAMAGTALLMIERPRCEELFLALRLRATTTPIVVDPARSTQCVLGTDFTYEDLRFWLPLEHLDHAQVRAAASDAPVAWCLSGRRLSRYGARMDVEAVLDGAHATPLTIVWRATETGDLLRMYEASAFQLIDGIHTPQQIVVERFPENYRSIMRLRRIRYNVQMRPEAFSIEGLRSISSDSSDQWLHLANDG